MHIQILSILRLSVPELWKTQPCHISITRTVTAHVLFHVAYHWRGSKYIHIFEIPGPNVSIYFVTFRAIRRRLRHVIVEK